jgi:hypothetical protein
MLVISNFNAYIYIFDKIVSQPALVYAYEPGEAMAAQFRAEITPPVSSPLIESKINNLI